MQTKPERYDELTEALKNSEVGSPIREAIRHEREQIIRELDETHKEQVEQFLKSGGSLFGGRLQDFF